MEEGEEKEVGEWGSQKRLIDLELVEQQQKEERAPFTSEESRNVSQSITLIVSQRFSDSHAVVSRKLGTHSQINMSEVLY